MSIAAAGLEPWPGRRIVLHADMDAFYAAIEERERPELRGRPVIVGGPRDARGVVSAASYEARSYGVRSALPLRTAARLCPHAAFLPPRFDLYTQVSRRILDLFRTYTPLVEPLSLDEAFLDITGCERRYGSPERIAQHLRAAVWRAERLTVSVGVAAGKSVAKIASELGKPDGCLVVAPGEEAGFLAPLPVRMIWGIGPRSAERLARQGVQSIGDLARYDPGRLETLLGTGLAKAARLARGADSRPVSPEATPKSAGHEVTFPQDVRDQDLVIAYLQQLAEHVAQRLREKGLRSRTVQLKLRYADFRTITRQVTLETPTDTACTIFRWVRGLFKQVAAPCDAYRLVGVHASGLTDQAYAQLSLTPPPGRDRGRLERALDTIRHRFGDGAVTPASLLQSQARMGADRYAWREAVLG